MTWPQIGLASRGRGRVTLLLLQLWTWSYVIDDVTGAKRTFAQDTSLLLDTLLMGYDNRLRPGFGGDPTLVDVNLNIRSMGPISDSNMLCQMDCYFRQSWIDKRLRFKSPLRTLPVSIKFLDRIWKPDTHFLNGKHSYLHTVTTPNKLLRIDKDGRLLYSMRLTIQTSCPMHLEKFPMDTQICPIHVGSNGYTESDVIYEWTHGAGRSIEMSSDLKLSQFDLLRVPAGNGTVDERGRRYSVLSAQFVLRRHKGYFLINFYMPCTLLVIISWVGFWINREATADRIALGITTVLTMTFMGIENRTDLPKVSHATALDVFVGVSFLFVLASIIQFATVHFFTNHGSGEPPPADGDVTEDDDDSAQSYTCSTNDRLSNRSARDSVTTANESYIYPNGSAAGRVNGRSSDALLLHNGSGSGYHRQGARNSGCTQLWSCLRGAASYRALKHRAKPWSDNSVSQIDRASRLLFPVAFVVFQVFYWLSYLDATAVEKALF